MPGSVTGAETFLWYRPEPRLQLGLAYLWEQRAFRMLANYVVVTESPTRPGLKVGAGLQGIATGNPGYFASIEKRLGDRRLEASAYAGIGWRANEDHAHGFGGVKLSFPGGWRLGIQLDGHETHPFTAYDAGRWAIGLYWANLRRPGYLIGFRW